MSIETDPEKFFPQIVTSCREAFGCDVVLTRYDPVTCSVVLSQIIAKEPGKGKGTQCMKYLLERLEEIGIKKINLVVSPLERYSIKQDIQRLIKWYGGFGFKVIDITNSEMELLL